MKQMITQSTINPLEFKELCPIFVFDLCNQRENLLGSVGDVQIKATFNNAVPANITAYAVTICGKVVHKAANKIVISVV